MKAKYITDINDILQLTVSERNAISKVTERFDFRTTDYYLSLIDWSNPADPIRRLIIPSTDELDAFGKMDPSEEHAYTVLPGLEHKYNSTALLLTSDVCAGICRYCFRKRLFMHQGKDVLKNIPAALNYIQSHPEITNILLTGGDPFILSTHKIDVILSGLRAIQHVQIIRIGTRMPVFNPYRILDDPELLQTLSRHSTPNKKLYHESFQSSARTNRCSHSRTGSIKSRRCDINQSVSFDSRRQ